MKSIDDRIKKGCNEDLQEDRMMDLDDVMADQKVDFILAGETPTPR